MNVEVASFAVAKSNTDVIDAFPEARTDQGDPNTVRGKIGQIDPMLPMKEVDGLSNKLGVLNGFAESAQFGCIDAVLEPKRLAPRVPSVGVRINRLGLLGA